MSAAKNLKITVPGNGSDVNGSLMFPFTPTFSFLNKTPSTPATPTKSVSFLNFYSHENGNGKLGKLRLFPENNKFKLDEFGVEPNFGFEISSALVTDRVIK